MAEKMSAEELQEVFDYIVGDISDGYSDVLLAKLTHHIATLQREADGMREALLAIYAGRIDLQFDETTGRPLWHVAFAQLQSLARAALNGSEKPDV